MKYGNLIGYEPEPTWRTDNSSACIMMQSAVYEPFIETEERDYTDDTGFSETNS